MMKQDYAVLARNHFSETSNNYTALQEQAPLIVNAAMQCVERMQRGGKVLFCGNGGSAADAQHLAAELMGRFLVDRHPLPAMALTVNTSSLTAIGNDYGYDDVFERQVRGVGNKEDILFGISTSGNSRNVVKALKAAKTKGMLTIGIIGQNGGAMGEICDISICVPSTCTPRIQEMHIGVGHMICEIIELEYL